MAVNAKNKGNTFERKIANMLSDHFQKFTGIEKAFRRNADSGSFFGGKNSARSETHDLDKASFGDIITPNNFKFNIECKHYKTPPSFSMLVKQDCKMLDKWIQQAKTDEESSKKKFVIIMKFNGVDEVVVLEDNYNNLPVLMNYKEFKISLLTDFLNLDASDFWN